MIQIEIENSFIKPSIITRKTLKNNSVNKQKTNTLKERIKKRMKVENKTEITTKDIALEPCSAK